MVARQGVWRDNRSFQALNGPSLEDWRLELAEPLAIALGDARQVGVVTRLCPPKGVADDTLKLLVRSSSGCPVAVVLCSAPASPGLVARNMMRMSEAKCLLGEGLGEAILDPLHEGELFGLSYSVLPYRQPLSENRGLRAIQRQGLRRSLYRWLRMVTAATVTGEYPGGRDWEFAGALEQLADMSELSSGVRTSAERALARLESGAWTPRRVLMHGDFWVGNVLLNVDTTSAVVDPWLGRLVIIDWPGSRVDGFAFTDLMTLAGSLRPSDRWLVREILEHCQILDCDPADARSYLMAALGDLAINREYFSLDRFTALAESSAAYFDRLGF